MAVNQESYKNALHDLNYFKNLYTEESKRVNQLEKDLAKKQRILDDLVKKLNGLETDKRELRKSVSLLGNKNNMLLLEKDTLTKELSGLKIKLKEHDPRVKAFKSKVTREDVLKVRELIKTNTYRVTAEVTNLSIKTISYIKNGRYDYLI